MSKIILTPGKACKCSCRQYRGNDNRTYWYDYKKDIVYSTDCHKENPTQAKGIFQIKNKIINQ